MNPFTWFSEEEFQGFVRHAMTSLGGVGVAAGHFDPTQWQAIVGAVVTLAGVGWSYAAKQVPKV